VEVFYFDQAGVQSCPCVPYRWQPQGETLALPAHERKRVTLMGFFNRDQVSHMRTIEGRVDSQRVIDAIDDFIGQVADPQRFTFIVLDNASIHTSRLFERQLQRWFCQQVIIYGLPTYSPELNLIEILWRKIKYEWLPLNAFGCIRAIKAALDEIIPNIGGKYRINFG
jgi:hypothetical protein